MLCRLILYSFILKLLLIENLKQFWRLTFPLYNVKPFIPAVSTAAVRRPTQLRFSAREYKTWQLWPRAVKPRQATQTAVPPTISVCDVCFMFPWFPAGRGARGRPALGDKTDKRNWQFSTGRFPKTYFVQWSSERYSCLLRDCEEVLARCGIPPSHPHPDHLRHSAPPPWGQLGSPTLQTVHTQPAPPHPGIFRFSLKPEHTHPPQLLYWATTSPTLFIWI